MIDENNHFFDLVEIGIINVNVSNRLGVLLVSKRTWTRPFQRVLNTLLLRYPTISLLNQVFLVNDGIQSTIIKKEKQYLFSNVAKLIC